MSEEINKADQERIKNCLMDVMGLMKNHSLPVLISCMEYVASNSRKTTTELHNLNQQAGYVRDCLELKFEFEIKKTEDEENESSSNRQ